MQHGSAFICPLLRELTGELDPDEVLYQQYCTHFPVKEQTGFHKVTLRASNPDRGHEPTADCGFLLAPDKETTHTNGDPLCTHNDGCRDVASG